MPPEPGEMPNTDITGEAAPPPVTEPPAVEEDDAFDRDRAMHTIRTLREKERAGEKAARERDELAKRLAEIEDAQKSEEERRQEELARLRELDKLYEKDKATWAAERAVLMAAPQAGITDVALAMAVLDTSTIEYDEQGRPTNVSDVLEALVEQHPALAGETPKAKPPRTDAKAGRARDDGPKLTADEMAAAQAMKMSPEDYARYKGLSTADQFAALSAASDRKE